MAKTANPNQGPVSIQQSTREPRPFVRIEPKGGAGVLPAEAKRGIAWLRSCAESRAAWLANALVDFTIARDLRRQRGRGRTEPIQVAVLNRRRRAARSWIEAILAGAIDAATLRSLAHSWLPQLCGTGPELDKSLVLGRGLFEFVRGALTALVFEEPQENLLPEARAMHGLEIVLATHLQAAVSAAHRG